MTGLDGMPYRGVMTRPDYSGAVVGTLIGLVQKGLWGLGTVWVLFIIFVFLMTEWWAWVLLALLVLPSLISILVSDRRTRQVVRAHEEEHRRKYGKEPEPWRDYPIHRRQP